MDFAKFVSLLDCAGLFFPRANLLGDSFEGSTPREVRAGLATFFASLPSKEDGKQPIDQMRVMSKFKKEFVRECFVSCWHMNEFESAAMWNLYTLKDAGVAIRSTYQKLEACLPNYANVGVINYIDYDSEIFPADHLMHNIMHKRKSFEHERELRAVVWERLSGPLGGEEIRKRATSSGLIINVDLENLIDHIYICPTSPDWVAELVKNVVEKYG